MPFTAPVTLILTSSLFLQLLLLQEGSAAPRCSEYDREPPTNCKYGTAKDWCHNGICAKGPGEICGGYHDEKGVCGEGTYCDCGRCRGCSPFDSSCHPGQIC